MLKNKFIKLISSVLVMSVMGLVTIGNFGGENSIFAYAQVSGDEVVEMEKLTPATSTEGDSVAPVVEKTVANVTEFRAALADTTIDRIVVSAEINVPLAAAADIISIERNLTIEGNGKLTLTAASSYTGQVIKISKPESSATGDIVVSISGVKIDNAGRTVSSGAKLESAFFVGAGTILNLSSSEIKNGSAIIETDKSATDRTINLSNNELIQAVSIGSQTNYFNTAVTKAARKRDLSLEGTVNVFNIGGTAGTNLDQLQNSKVEFVAFEQGQDFSTTGGIRVNVSSQIATATVTGGVAKFTATIKESALKDGMQYSVYLVITDPETNYVKSQVMQSVQEIDAYVGNVSSYSVDLNVIGNTADGVIQIELLDSKGNSLNPVVKQSKTGNGTVTFPNLNAGTTYKYKVTNSSGAVISTSMDTFTTKNSIVSGNGDDSSTSTSTSGITSSDIRKSTIGDVYVDLYLNSTNLKALKDAKNITVNIDGLKVDGVVGDKLVIKGFVPGKDYKNLVIKYTDADGKNKEIKVSTFTTKKDTTKLNQFVIDVYRESLSREADEEGFNFWIKQLTSGEIKPGGFVVNLLNEPEFIKSHTTTDEIIEALYNVVVNRSSDVEGANFWINKFDSYVNSGFTRKLALDKVANEMVNEKEFLDRVKSLNI